MKEVTKGHIHHKQKVLEEIWFILNLLVNEENPFIQFADKTADLKLQC